MPVAGPDLGKAVLEMLQAKRVAFHPLHKLTSIDPDSGTVFFQEKEPFKYELLVAIPPHRPPSVVRGAGITNEAGWVPLTHEHFVPSRKMFMRLETSRLFRFPDAGNRMCR